MKHITLLTLAVAVFAASCSNKNGVFTKRKYTKGHYVAHAGKVAKPVEHASKAAEVKFDKTIETVVVNKQTADKPTSKQTVVASVNSKKINTSKAVKPVVINQSKTNELTKADNKGGLMQRFTANKAVNKIKKATKQQAADDNLIVMVILSLFPILCLIAVWMHDGKAITLNFWIDLILHLTVWGCCIWALLVVLDVINLA